jgi:hypothetical protein
MLIDNQQMFSDGQTTVVNVTPVASTNVLDMASTGYSGGVPNPDTGVATAAVSTSFPDYQGGTRLQRFANGEMESATIYVTVTGVTGPAATLTVALQGCNRSDFGAAITTIESITTASLAISATAVYTTSINPNFQLLAFRYYRLLYTWSANVTACSISASWVLDLQTANPTFPNV